jgi:hypothetical protein
MDDSPPAEPGADRALVASREHGHGGLAFPRVARQGTRRCV